MKRRNGGFTLLEMLVALAVVAIGLMAALRASGAGAEGTLAYRTHLLAHWLAQDVAAERAARRDWPEPGVSSVDAEMGGQRFRLRQEIKATPNPHFRRLEISVADAADTGHVVARQVAFLTRPER